MTQKRKILFLEVPKALAAAMAQHLPVDYFFISSDPQDLKTADLVIHGKKIKGNHPMIPMLDLRAVMQSPLRLGHVLRQIAAVLSHPLSCLQETNIGTFVFRPQTRVLAEKNKEDIILTDREAEILAYLSRHRGAIVSRDELLKNVWRYGDGVDTHTLETHVYRLRQKMSLSAEDTTVLATETGGYVLV